MKRSISIPTDTLWQAGFLLLPPLTAAWLMAVHLRRPALGPALSGAAGQRPVHRPAVLAPVWSNPGASPPAVSASTSPPVRGARPTALSSPSGAPPSCPGISPPWAPPADVAGSYRFTPTWQMLAAVALAAALVVFLHPEKHKARLRLTGTRRPLRLVCLGAGLACPPTPVPHRAAGAFRC